MINVESNTVKLTYCADDNTLTAVYSYKPTSEYRYFNVSEEDGNYIKTNGLSLGSYMNQVIKKKYTFEEILL